MEFPDMLGIGGNLLNSRGNHMKRIHNSHDPDLNVTFKLDKIQSTANKPIGLWYGISDSGDVRDSDWIQWCISQGYEDDPNWIRPYYYEVLVKEELILKIGSKSELMEFRKKYEYIPRWFQDKIKESWIDLLKQVDWERVKQDYGGIEINPYIRFNIFRSNYEPMPTWYSAWDCSSVDVFGSLDSSELKD
jgi:hypothetical protein